MSRSDSRDHTTIWLIPMVVLLVVGVRADLFVWGDTWYNLTLGREIASHGIMRVDTLSAVWLGLPVTDAQWFAHVLFYAVARAFGVVAVPTLGLMLVATTVLTVAWAHVRHSTPRVRPGIMLLTVALVLMGIASQLVLRAQTLVYPLVVVVLWTLQRRMTTDPQTEHQHNAPWVLVPVFVLWANLHGSVLLAPLFVGAACAVVLVEGVTGRRPTWRRDVMQYAALAVAAAGSVLCTPYGIGMLDYYRATAGSARLREMVSEWFPLWAAPEVGIVLLVSMIAAPVLRARGQWFARLVLAGVAFMAVMSLRHATPLALAALVLMPPLLEQVVPARWTFAFPELPARLVQSVTALAALWLCVGVPWRLSPSLAEVQVGSPIAALRRVAAGQPRACFFIDEQQAERFLWFAPELTGRVAHGVRVETLPHAYLLRVAQVYGQPDAARSHDYLAQFNAVVLDGRLREQLVSSLKADSGFVEVASHGPVHVFQSRARMHALPPQTPCETAREEAVTELAARSPVRSPA